jgi:hypothetical protein
MPPDVHKYLKKKSNQRKMYEDFRKSKKINILVIIYMFYAINDRFLSMCHHFSTVLPTQLRLFPYILTSFSWVVSAVYNVSIVFLLATSQYFTYKNIFKIFMKICVNLEACCFKRFCLNN